MRGYTLIGAMQVHPNGVLTWRGYISFDVMNECRPVDLVRYTPSAADFAIMRRDKMAIVESIWLDTRVHATRIAREVSQSMRKMESIHCCCDYHCHHGWVTMPSAHLRVMLGRFCRFGDAKIMLMRLVHPPMHAFIGPAPDLSLAIKRLNRIREGSTARGNVLLAILVVHADGRLTYRGNASVDIVMGVLNFKLSDFAPRHGNFATLRTGGVLTHVLEVSQWQYNSVILEQLNQSTIDAEKHAMACKINSPTCEGCVVVGRRVRIGMPSLYQECTFNHPYVLPVLTRSVARTIAARAVPPAAPLVGVELNPGPGSWKTVHPSSAQQSAAPTTPAPTTPARELYHRLADGRFVLALDVVRAPLAPIAEDAKEVDIDETMSVSMHTAMVTSMSTNASKIEKKAAYDDMRKHYVYLIMNFDQSKWRSVFRQVADQFAAANADEQPGKKRIVSAASAAAAAAAVAIDHSDQTISFATSETPGKIVTFNRKLNPVIIIGRSGVCDVQFMRDVATSRCHVVVLCNPGAEIMIIDVGSLEGWDIESRSRPGLPHSGYQKNSGKSKRTTVISCDTDEVITMRWLKRPKNGILNIRGPASPRTHNYVQINPLVCVACMDSARSVKYKSCGHLALCATCNTKQKDNAGRVCELCRVPVADDQLIKNNFDCMTHA